MSVVEGDVRPIVVGFDGSSGARAALRWAAQEASFRGAPLKIVQAWTEGEFGTAEELGEYTQTELEKECREEVTYPSVHWEALAEHGRTVDVLVEESETAQMLVLGTRHYGLLSELAHGSVGLRAATREGAPVVVVVRD